ncbi:hypothetical protein [Mucilaginibacter ginsenosidivorax]|uniref:Uncharacterized protein n=1 Tax=Mucilaginibacter ginsenosidivorax TaxID=862126 RepID=A0A5B8W511_9SPHI|nr:hypothetical protein [Mucilaginibacter ginsenosidivorax]QEC78833.1 hypothetical protein FSB76_23830 [Mucilaginibacter ginsenosidivorax]
MNTYQFKQTGGAKYASLRATWPFATLTVTQNQLSLNLSLYTLHFRPADVVSIEPYSDNFSSGGILINHIVPNYKTPVVFKPTGDAHETMAQIGKTGFLDNKAALQPDIDTQIIDLQSQGAFAMKIPAVIIIIVIWNALLIPQFYRVVAQNNPRDMFMGMRLATGFMALLCLTFIVSVPFRNLILKEGRTFKDIKMFIYFILAICSIMFLVSLLMPEVA